MSQKSAAEVNAERIEAIIAEAIGDAGQSRRLVQEGAAVFYREPSLSVMLARKIVEAFWELQGGLQQTSERDGSARTIVNPLPWQGDRT
jgi:hypothetical protein